MYNAPFYGDQFKLGLFSHFYATSFEALLKYKLSGISYPISEYNLSLF